MVKVLFVCMGNICRSPTAEGVFRSLVDEQGLKNRIEVDSAGTHAYHVGNAPDNRATESARRRKVDISSQKARKVNDLDFEFFDYILVMDRDNYSNLLEICPEVHENKIQLFLEFDTANSTMEVPDPYYGGAKGFEHVLDLVEAASEGLLTHIKQYHLS